MKVSVTVHSVEGLPGHSGLLNKTDAYVELKYGTWHEHCTPTKKDSGASATFEDTWTFESNDSHTEIDIKARDAKHLKMDENLAEGSFKFENRSGYYYSGDVGLVNMHHCKEPSVKVTVRVD